MLRIYVDADVLLAGLLSPSDHGAANVLLQRSEATILDAVVSERVISEVERNLEDYVDRSEATSLLDESIDAALDVVPNPSSGTVDSFRGVADPKDALHVACAIDTGCSHLVTNNLSDYPPEYSGQPVEDLTIIIRSTRGITGILIADTAEVCRSPPAEFYPVISTEGPALPGPSGEIFLRTGGTGRFGRFCLPV